MVEQYFSLVGEVIVMAVAILLLSGLALYVGFRLRETLRDENGRGARAAKVAFLVGLLFLSGGAFYLFASGFSSSAGAGSNPVTTSAVAPSPQSFTTTIYRNNTQVVTTVVTTSASASTASYQTTTSAASTTSSGTTYTTTVTTTSTSNPGGICLPIIGCL